MKVIYKYTIDISFATNSGQPHIGTLLKMRALIQESWNCNRYKLLQLFEDRVKVCMNRWMEFRYQLVLHGFQHFQQWLSTFSIQHSVFNHGWSWGNLGNKSPNQAVTGSCSKGKTVHCHHMKVAYWKLMGIKTCQSPRTLTGYGTTFNFLH